MGVGHSLTSTLFRPVESSNRPVPVKLIESSRYLFGRLFGCWHRQMGLPITLRGQTLRTCSKCGIHRHFDLETWRMKGCYYHDPRNGEDGLITGFGRAIHRHKEEMNAFADCCDRMATND
jgi:hypothetical protein